TIPAVAVEGSMYGAVGSSAEITSLVTQFLPGQVALATTYGFNPQVFASEALGLAFAFGNSTAGDAAFAAAASSLVFGAAATANTPVVIENWVAHWKLFIQ